MKITEKIPEDGLFSYQYIQKTETGAIPIFDEDHSIILSLPWEYINLNLSGNYANMYKNITIVPDSVYNHFADYFSFDLATLKKQAPDDQNLSDTISVFIKPHSKVQIELNQNLFYIQSGNSSSFLQQQLNQDYKVSLPIQIGSIRIIPSIQRLGHIKTGTQQAFSILFTKQLQDMVFPLLAADLNQWIREPLLTLDSRNIDSAIQTADLSETISLNTIVETPSVWIPNTINLSVSRKGSLSGIINSSDLGIYTSVGKNWSGNNGAKYLWSINSKFSFDTVFNWYYKSRTMTSSFNFFGMLNFPGFSITSDINGSFKDVSANENNAILESSLELPFKESYILISAGITLNRPKKYTDLLLDMFTHANHKDSLQIEANGFIDEKIPSFGTSRIIFRSTYKHESSFYIEEDAALNIFITLQSGREQFWIIDNSDYRDSLGIEMGISATLYL